MASCPGDQGVMESGGCTKTGSFSQSLWEQRVPDVSMGWGWSASKNEPVQGLSVSGPLAQFGRDNMASGSIIGGGLLGSQGLRSSEGCGVSEEQPTRESGLTLYQA